MRVPSNKIVTGKYTSGGELADAKTNAPYQGYYYELNKSLYAGKEFKNNAPKLVKIEDANKLYNRYSTALYSAISGVTSQQLQQPKLVGINTSSNPVNNKNTTRFFTKKINVQPIIIKEVDEETYKSLQNNPIYQTTYVGVYNGKNQTLDQAEKQMPGIETFLLG
jgi:hypothetical protein